MHIFIYASFIIAFFLFGGKTKAKKYHATMLFVIVANLLYSVICSDHILWHYELADKRFEFIIELLYTFTVLPITAFLFLEHLPPRSESINFFLHFFKWEAIYLFVEWLMVQFGTLKYENSWTILWSAIFLIVMFPCIYLHHKKPIVAYSISVVFIIFLIYYFEVPILIPLEDRR